MALEKYNEKRDFNQTEEPVGIKKGSQKDLIFVVQKHRASHLHYDFRLELNGVLLSWAIPKGPSMNPDDKRLAVLVEDHPYDYKDFEGQIPKGNYGAGTVIVWDNGIYEPATKSSYMDVSNTILDQFNKGHLSFILKGKKLKGRFSLVKLKAKDDNAWLLLKKEDQYASSEDILLKDKSVLTKKSIEDLEDAKEDSNSKSPEILSKVNFEKPMLATLSEKIFDHPDWIFENKYDGYRVISVIDGDKINLYSRNHNSYTENFKSIADELQNLSHQVVLDGEIVVEDEKWRSNFQMLQLYLKDKKGILTYYVFDILNLDGNDVTHLPLANRKELLELLFAKQKFKNIKLAPFVVNDGKSRLKQAEKENSEGIIAKRSDSLYQVGKRSGDWLKIKLVQQEEAVIIGITAPSGNRSYFGAVLLAQFIGDDLVFIGKCGTGFTEQHLSDLYKKMKPLFRKTCPIKTNPKLRDKVQWLTPKLVCQVKFTEWTKDNHLRHPVFLGLRDDKNAEEVMFENYSSEAAASKLNVSGENDFDLKIGKITLHLTNQNKTYFPETGIAKGELIEYYNEVAPLILPYLKDRPQSLNRFPNGINGTAFYQKNIDTEKVPSWLKTKKLYSDSNENEINYLLCNDKQTLLYMANLGCIEINPWNSTTKNIDNPDWMVIDIDPEKDEFMKVVETALTVKEIMDEVNTPCYCKTSGASGLHVYIPLHAKYDYETAKIFAQVIATEVQSRLPKTTTLERSISKRNHKIYIDYLQNRKGQTIASAYCVRPKEGATVSTPLEWNEVNADLNPKNFTIKTVLKRFSEKGDLWKGVLEDTTDIHEIIEQMT